MGSLTPTTTSDVVTPPSSEVVTPPTTAPDAVTPSSASEVAIPPDIACQDLATIIIASEGHTASSTTSEDVAKPIATSEDPSPSTDTSEIFASTTMSEAQEATELEDSLPAMTLGIAEAMEALYNVQKVLIKANRPDSSDKLQEIRGCLQKYWKNIVSILEDSYQLASDVVYLHQEFQSADRELLRIVMEELISSCTGCKSRVKTLIDQHKESTTHYGAFESIFESAIGVLSNSSRGDKQKTTFSLEETQSMKKFVNACETFRKGVENFAAFFDAQRVAFKEYLATAQGRGCGREISLQEADRFAAKWAQRKYTILQACVEILRVCDAIMIAPKGIHLSPKESIDVQNQAGNWFLDLLDLLKRLKSQLTQSNADASYTPSTSKFPQN